MMDINVRIAMKGTLRHISVKCELQFIHCSAIYHFIFSLHFIATLNIAFFSTVHAIVLNCFYRLYKLENL